MELTEIPPRKDLPIILPFFPRDPWGSSFVNSTVISLLSFPLSSGLSYDSLNGLGLQCWCHHSWLSLSFRWPTARWGFDYSASCLCSGGMSSLRGSPLQQQVGCFSSFIRLTSYLIFPFTCYSGKLTLEWTVGMKNFGWNNLHNSALYIFRYPLTIVLRTSEISSRGYTFSFHSAPCLGMVIVHQQLRGLSLDGQ